MTWLRARATTSGGNFPNGLDQRVLISRGQKALCSTVVPTGGNKWAVVRGTTTVATWSK